MSQTHDGPDRGSTYRTPRWVKVFGIIAIGLVLLVVVVLLVATALGLHTPSQVPLSSVREDGVSSGGDLAGHTSRSSVTEYGGP